VSTVVHKLVFAFVLNLRLEAGEQLTPPPPKFMQRALASP